MAKVKKIIKKKSAKTMRKSESKSEMVPTPEPKAWQGGEDSADHDAKIEKSIAENLKPHMERLKKIKKIDWNK